MRKLKHNKIKNTGLLFEILTRMTMYETLDPEQKQSAIRIIKRHFKPNSEILKELRLYQTLNNHTNSDSKELLGLTLESRNDLNKDQLQKEKYGLIKSIGKDYNLDVFFNTRVSNYKLTASIFKLFEYAGKDNPEEYLNSKSFILEHLSGKPPEIPEEEVIATFRELDPQMRKLSFKLLIESFNEKYQDLNTRQKQLLTNYINANETNDDFKDYVLKEVSWIVKTLSGKMANVDDPITKIKLNEVINLSQTIISAKVIKEEHLTSMLKFHELIEVLDNE